MKKKLLIVLIILLLIIISISGCFDNGNNKTKYLFNKHKIADIEFDAPYVEQIAISNDDKMIAWNERNYKEDKCSIFISNTDGTEYKKIYSSSDYCYPIEFSSNNTKLKFKKGSNYYQMNLDGSNIVQISDYLTYQLKINDNEFILTNKINVSYIDDEGNITYQNHTNLVYYNKQENKTIELTQYFTREYSDFFKSGLGWVIRCSDYHPTEKYIIYSLWFDDGSIERRSSYPWDDFIEGIYRVNLDGTNNICLIQKWQTWGAKLSPNYSKILFHTGATSHDNPIWIMDANGKNAKQLTNTERPRNYEGRAFFTGDGKKIIYGNFIQEDHTNIWMMNLDGSDKTMITDDKAEYDLETIGPNGKNIYYLKGRGTGELWVMIYE